jgi:hypothetical protein
MIKTPEAQEIRRRNRRVGLILILLYVIAVVGVIVLN